jgi:outer membrane protein OmpA-like peptidoglycan-associated protein
MIKLYTIAAMLLPGMLFFPLLTKAQYKEDYARAAALFYADRDYYSSAKYYELFLNSSGTTNGARQNPYVIQKRGDKPAGEGTYSKSKLQAVYQLAESYRLLNDYEHAEKWYGIAAADAAGYPLAAYWHGISLRANGKYDAAEKVLTQFVKSYGRNDVYLQRAHKELLNLAFIKEQLAKKDSVAYKVAQLASAVNMPGFASYATAVAGNTVYFTSTRRDTTRQETPYFNKLYTFSKDNRLSQKAGIPEKAAWEQGVAALAPDGKKIYLTRWQKKQDNENRASLYSSELTGDTWSEPIADSSVNVEGYNTQQPYITTDGKYLLFASDRPGGAGGFDIWYRPLTGHGKPVNAGRQINTAGNEQAPFYHTPTATLVFAADSRIGMGGYDLCSSNGNIISGQWTPPVNLGYPLNSVKDDLYFTSTGNSNILEEGYLSSDRASGCCLQLFAVNALPPVPAIPVVVKTAVPLKDSIPVKEQVVIVSKPSRALEVKIYFDFDESILQSVSNEMLDSLAAALNKAPGMLVEIAGYTDGKGEEAYNIRLAQERAEACYNYLVQQKQIAADRLSVKAYGECCPVEKEYTANGQDNRDGRKLNRRVEFKISGIK